jgi:hypothetical protein
LPVRPQNRFRVLTVEVHAAAEQRGQLDQAEFELGDDSQPASSAKCPEQLPILGIDPDRPAFGVQDGHPHNAVRGEPERPADGAQAATEGVADHADAGRCAGQTRQAERR